MIQGNPHIKKEDKPQSREAIFKLSTDEKPEPVKVKKPTKKELELYQRIQFGLNNMNNEPVK